MVMSGEGADETLAGYLYFHKAPNGTELHEECVRKVGDLHYYDCLRANKATMAHGLEVRVPFLDKEMMDVTMRTDPEYKLRKAGAPTQVGWPARGGWGGAEVEVAVVARRGTQLEAELGSSTAQLRTAQRMARQAPGRLEARIREAEEAASRARAEADEAQRHVLSAGRQGAAAAAQLQQALEREAKAQKEARAAAKQEARASRQADAALMAAALERSLARAAAQLTGWALARWCAATAADARVAPAAEWRSPPSHPSRGGGESPRTHSSHPPRAGGGETTAAPLNALLGMVGMRR